MSDFPDVTVYSSPECSACRTIKEFLSRNHVSFEEKNLREPRWLEELGETYGAYSAPSVVINNELIEGGLPAIADALGLDS